jgi:hypothetical protein
VGIKPQDGSRSTVLKVVLSRTGRGTRDRGFIHNYIDKNFPAARDS